MKIALVTPYEYPYPGGVTEHISALDREFRARGHDTRIIAATTDDQLEGNVMKVSGMISAFPFSGSTARITLSPQAYRRVKQILRAERFDIVHIHEPPVPLLSLAVLRHSHAVNVGTFHAYRETNALYEYGRPVAARVFGRLDGRIFVSEAVRDYITHYFPGEHTIIPNGIDLSRFASPAVRPIPRFNDGRQNILFLGRLEPRKGFRYLLEAYPIIKQALPDCRLIVAGAYHKEDKEPFVHLVRRHGLRGVHFVGRLSNTDLVRYYRTATLFCAPSTGFESFGLVLLEAMAAGVPVVASDIAGYRAVLQNRGAGQLVPAERPDELATAIIRLLRDPERLAAMKKAGQAAAKEYDWPLVATRVLDYYTALWRRRQALPPPIERRTMRSRLHLG